MLLGFNTNGLQNHRLDDALRLLADQGYAAVAITPDVCHLDPMRCSAAEIDGIAATLARLGLAVTIETGARFVLDPAVKHEPTLMTRSVEARAERVAFYRRCAEIGRDLGAEVVSFWAGVDRSPDDDSAAWLQDGVAQTCDEIRSCGLTPALEPEPGMAVETVAEWAALRAALGDAGPALCLDIGHLYVTREGTPQEILAQHGTAVVQVHLEDIRYGVHEHLPPGQGDVDFGAVHAALRRVPYRGPVCFELSRSSHEAPRVVALCRDTWAAAADGA